MDYIFTEMIVEFMLYLHGNDTTKRIPALIALIISFLIVRPKALKEWRNQGQNNDQDYVPVNEF